ncbi:MAG: MotA/TolQ/ExbB proton channel family protein [Verrucomicrobiota bacterium]
MKCFSTILFSFLLLASASAQLPETLTQPTGEPLDWIAFRDYLQQGGIMMYPLAALSFFVVLLVFFYFFTIRKGTVVTNRFMNQAESLLRSRDYLGLIAVCSRSNQAISHVMNKTLDFVTKNPETDFDEAREVAEAEGTRQAGLLNQRITYLNDIGSIAPMVGLLGTVLGMIKSFNEIAETAQIGARQMDFAGGVSEALITTASGLVVGIPALVFYSYFRGRVQSYVSELEAAATHLMALFSAQQKRGGAVQGFSPEGHPDEAYGRYALGRERRDPQGL